MFQKKTNILFLRKLKENYIELKILNKINAPFYFRIKINDHFHFL